MPNDFTLRPAIRFRAWCNAFVTYVNSPLASLASSVTPRTKTRFPARSILACTVLPSLVLLAGCNAREAAIYGTVGATLLGGYAPANEIEQVYYLGVFDPQEQLPETVYRLTIHGQASAISGMKFGSGWVHADLIDSLNSRAAFDDSGHITITRSVSKKKEGGSGEGESGSTPGDSAAAESTTVTISKSRDSEFPSLETGRRLMLFGPEGFREAPKNHRLVVVMGSNPEAFFNAIDQSLGIVSEVFREQRNTGLAQKIFKAMIKIKDERQVLTQLTVDIAKDMPETKGAQG